MNNHQGAMPIPAYNVKDVTRPRGPIARSELYAAINRGDLKAKKLGRRTIIPVDAWTDFISNLPDFQAAA